MVSVWALWLNLCVISDLDFKYDVPEGARGLYERYDEQTADDFMLDLTEEIIFEAIDERLPKLQRRKLSEFKERKGTKINPFE